jgi:hypothetical protein
LEHCVPLEFEAGDFAIARDYYRRLMAEFPREIRVFAARKALTHMDDMEAALREGRTPPQEYGGALNKQILSSLKSKTPWIVIGVVFLWAVVSMGMRRREAAAVDTVTIRIAHWQLEAEHAKGWRRPPPNTKSCIRMCASSRGYSRKHLRAVDEHSIDGGTAPDIVQAGMVEANLMTAFLPVTSFPFFLRDPAEPLQCGNGFGGKPPSFSHSKTECGVRSLTKSRNS